MFNYLHKKFYTKYGHILAAIFISLPTYLKHLEPEKEELKFKQIPPDILSKK